MRARNCREIKKAIKQDNKRDKRPGIFFFFSSSSFLQDKILLLKQLYIGIRHLEPTRIMKTLQQAEVISAAL